MTVRRSGRARWSIDPLIALLGRFAGEAGLTDEEAATALRCNPDSFGRWRRRGYVTDAIADQVAAELVGHPSMVWPTWWAGAGDWTPPVDVDAGQLAAAS